MAEVAEGALRLFSARVRGSPYCGVQPLSVTTPIAEKFARHAWSARALPRAETLSRRRTQPEAPWR